MRDIIYYCSLYWLFSCNLGLLDRKCGGYSTGAVTKSGGEPSAQILQIGIRAGSVVPFTRSLLAPHEVNQCLRRSVKGAAQKPRIFTPYLIPKRDKPGHMIPNSRICGQDPFSHEIGKGPLGRDVIREGSFYGGFAYLAFSPLPAPRFPRTLFGNSDKKFLAFAFSGQTRLNQGKNPVFPWPFHYGRYSRFGSRLMAASLTDPIVETNGRTSTDTDDDAAIGGFGAMWTIVRG